MLSIINSLLLGATADSIKHSLDNVNSAFSGSRVDIVANNVWEQFDFLSVNWHQNILIVLTSTSSQYQIISNPKIAAARSGLHIYRLANQLRFLMPYITFSVRKRLSFSNERRLDDRSIGFSTVVKRLKQVV